MKMKEHASSQSSPILRAIKTALLSLHFLTMFAISVAGTMGINNLMRKADGVSLSEPGGAANVACFYLLLSACGAILAACKWHRDYNGLLFAFFPAAFALVGATGFSAWGMIVPAALMLACAPVPVAFALFLMKIENSASAV